MIFKTIDMPKTFQIEFPQTEYFQSRLNYLVDAFSSIACDSISVNCVANLCLKALPDITPALIDDYLSREEGVGIKSTDIQGVFQRTTNLGSSGRDRLEAVKLNLLVKHKRDISRRDIMLGIIFTASELKNADLEYIYSEYQ